VCDSESARSSWLQAFQAARAIQEHWLFDQMRLAALFHPHLAESWRQNTRSFQLQPSASLSSLSSTSSGLVSIAELRLDSPSVANASSDAKFDGDYHHTSRHLDVRHQPLPESRDRRDPILASSSASSFKVRVSSPGSHPLLPRQQSANHFASSPNADMRPSATAFKMQANLSHSKSLKTIERLVIPK
jgi:hypothetical protein